VTGRGLGPTGVRWTLVLAALTAGGALAPWTQAQGISERGVDLSPNGVLVVAAASIAALLALLYAVTRWSPLWLFIAVAGAAGEASAYRERAHIAHLNSLDLVAWGLKVDLVAPGLLALAAIFFAALVPDRKVEVRTRSGMITPGRVATVRSAAATAVPREETPSV
jgi:hypothetical protein